MPRLAPAPNENAQAGHRIVARQDDDLDPLDRVGVEAQQFLDEVKRDARLCRLLQTLELESHVSAIVGRFEHRVSSSKSKRARELIATTSWSSCADAGMQEV